MRVFRTGPWKGAPSGASMPSPRRGVSARSCGRRRTMRTSGLRPPITLEKSGRISEAATESDAPPESSQRLYDRSRLQRGALLDLSGGGCRKLTKLPTQTASMSLRPITSGCRRSPGCSTTRLSGVRRNRGRALPSLRARRPNASPPNAMARRTTPKASPAADPGSAMIAPTPNKSMSAPKAKPSTAIEIRAPVATPVRQRSKPRRLHFPGSFPRPSRRLADSSPKEAKDSSAETNHPNEIVGQRCCRLRRRPEERAGDTANCRSVSQPSALAFVVFSAEAESTTTQADPDVALTIDGRSSSFSEPLPHLFR
jgi:hypothetical protein